MSRRFVTVLYEDERVEGEKDYGPHMLLLACLADHVGGDRWTLRKTFVELPMKGDGKLKKVLSQEGTVLADRGPLVALFDHDKVRACYGVAANACKRDLLQVIYEQAKGSPTIVFLEQNMEDLVQACCVAMGLPGPKAKPKPPERDRILQHAAAAHHTVRSKILEAMPSFRRLVEQVCVAYSDLGLTPP